MSDGGRIIVALIDSAFKHHTEYNEVSADVEQRVADASGMCLEFRFDVPMPRGAIAAARLSSKWGWPVASRDEALFSDSAGNFLAASYISRQRCLVSIPYGVLELRKAGLYHLNVKAMLPDARGGVTPIGETTKKVALPVAPPWKKIEYLWPLISLCMAVVRADSSVVREEIGPLKRWLTDEYGLKPEDMRGLRLAMRNTNIGAIEPLVSRVRNRLTMLSAQELMELLFRVALYDGGVNSDELETLRVVASSCELDNTAWSKLVQRYGAV